MINLLDETVDALMEHGKHPSEVLWVGNSEWHTTWDAFTKVANRRYDDGLGREEVNGDLMIVGQDWWLERKIYDGQEEWAFKTQPKLQGKKSTGPPLVNWLIWKESRDSE